LSIRKKKKFKFFSINIVGLICISSFINVQAQPVFEQKTSSIDTSYLKSRNQLKDYILDTGDILNIEFLNTPELSGLYPINQEGEIYLKRIKGTYVRGLTMKELKTLLETRYQEFLLDPEIYIRIDRFKPLKIVLKGEVRNPGVIRIEAFKSLKVESEIPKPFTAQDKILYNQVLPKQKEFVSTVSSIIRESGGLTSKSDISKIEVIRDIPKSDGGGKKKALIDLSSFIANSNTEMDIRLFDGDIVYIPSLKVKDPNILPNSILSGLTPKFINVSISGAIENPGTVKVPVEGSLADAMNLAGPRKPLSGKVFLIRYNRDGTLLRKNISYYSSASPGTSNNPYLISGDLITIKSGFFGRATSSIKAFTDPFIGIYAAKELIENFNN
tara:strand:- start:615 stop:1769 length:1155 start_codon:yes stop_codon:yes gene_type:complete